MLVKRQNTLLVWRSGRVVDGAALEMLCRATYRGFESHLLRQFKNKTATNYILVGGCFVSIDRRENILFLRQGN